VSVLRIEPTSLPDDGSEYGILDEEGNELAVVFAGREWACRFAASLDLLAALRGYVGRYQDAGDALEQDARRAIEAAEGRQQL
jgi:hypothetical protein